MQNKAKQTPLFLIRWSALVFMSVIALSWANTVLAEQINKPQPPLYPDAWYRLYDWPMHLCDKFFSDKKIWGDEPVLILCNGRNHTGFAEGFFSQKRLNITMRESKLPSDSRTGIYRVWRYYYLSGEELKIRELTKKGPDPAQIRLPDGGRLGYEEERGMEWSDRDTSSDRKKILPLIHTYACEPIPRSFARYDRHGSPVWAKSIVRYYRNGEAVPPHAYGEGVCDGYEAWLSAGAERSPLLLPDNTLLVSGYPYTYVVRIRLTDGSSGVLPPSLKVIDRQSLRNAKEEIVQRYLDEIARRAPNLKKWQAMGGMPADMPVNKWPYAAERHTASMVHDEFSNPERLYRTLASYFFEESSQEEYLK